MKIAERFEKPSNVKRILLVQLGDIGDVVWFLPVLQIVREAYRQAEVSVLVREGNAALLLAQASPPKVFEVQKKNQALANRIGAFRRLVLNLRRERFDLVFDFRGDERGAYMAFLTGAPVRATLYYPTLPWVRNRLFTHLVSPEGEPITSAGGADQSLCILRAFGIKDGGAIIPEIRLSAKVRCRALEILAAEGIIGGAEQKEDSPRKGENGCWVTVNPFSRWSYKEWELGKWMRIIDWIWQSFGLASVIVGSPAERERAEELLQGCTGRVFNLVGKTTLAELAGVLGQSRLHIGVDSAAPHIAAAVGTATVTLYGPSDWRYWAPPGERHRVVAPEIACAPCHKKGCDGMGRSLCLDQLEVARVQQTIGEALSKDTPSADLGVFENSERMIQIG